MCSAAVETYYFFVFSNPVAGHEDEYNNWYNEQHAPDVVFIPGFVTAQRFVKTDLPLYRMVDLQVPNISSYTKSSPIILKRFLQKSQDASRQRRR